MRWCVNRWRGGTIGVHSLSLASLDSSLREGAGNGCIPFNRVLAKTEGYGRFSSPLRKLRNFNISPFIVGHSLSLAFARQLPQGGSRERDPSNANKKIPVPKEILGTRTEWIFCGTTLFAAGAATSCRRQHVRCLITPALRQKILSECCSPCPRRPICRLAYRPALSYAGLSVGATPALLPPHRFRI